MNARACVHRTTVHVCVECLCVTFPSFLRVYAKTQSEPMNGRRGHRNREVHCDGKMPTPSIFVSFYLPISRTYVSERRRRPLSSLMLLPLPLPYLHMRNVVVRLYSLIFPCQPFTLYIVVYAARCVCYTYTCPVCVCCAVHAIYAILYTERLCRLRARLYVCRMRETRVRLRVMYCFVWVSLFIDLFSAASLFGVARFILLFFFSFIILFVSFGCCALCGSWFLLSVQCTQHRTIQTYTARRGNRRRRETGRHRLPLVRWRIIEVNRVLRYGGIK